MINRRLNTALIFRMLLICGTSAALVYFALVRPNYFVLPFLGLALIIECWNLVWLVNSTHRKLAYFFDAIRNEDTTLKFPDNVKNKSVKALHTSLNNLNNMISDIKIQNETSERFFRELIEQSSTGLMSLDEEGYVEVMNHTAKKYLGVVHLAHIRLLEQKNPAIFEVITQVKPGEKRIVKLNSKQGVVNLTILSSELRFGKKYYKLISLHDIRHELEEAEMDTWQKLIRVMTHEIMNSIAPITSLTQTLSGFFHKNGREKTPGDLTEDVIRNTLDGLSVIEERGKGLMHFVHNYRKLTKVPESIFAPLAIAPWIQGFSFLFQSELQENGIDFECIRDEQVKEILTDEKLLNQVLINLMVNAIHAVTQKEPPGNKRITLSVHRTPAGSARIELADNGCGMEEDLMDKIFIPFFTTKEGGSGIGLSLSRQIIRKLNGKLTAQSIKNKGSRFIVEI